jgi:parallel beta-helix repeat protein
LEALNIKEIGPEKYAFKSLSGDVIEIGTERHSPPQPYLKLNKWDGEVTLKVDIPYGVNGQGSFLDNRLSWANHKYDVDFYPRQPEEVTEEIAGQKHTFTINEEGGVEFDVILKEKPESNVFEFPIETKGLKFYYQPPLHPEHPTWADEDNDGKADNFRSENVVGSYAVYHQTQDKSFKTEEEAEKFKVGKAFHIYRPKVTDAKGNETWGELNIDEKERALTITIDQNWLNKAVYPVNIDPNFGYETAGSSSMGIYQYINTHGDTYTGADGVGKSMTANCSSTSGLDRNLALALYNGTALVENTVMIPVPNGAVQAWRTGNFASKPVLSAAEYSLAWQAYGAQILIYYDTAGTNNYKDCYEATFGVWPDPITWTTQADVRQFSIYCTYSQSNVFTDDVGIGTSDPDAKLHLTGGGMLQTISSAPIFVGSSGFALNEPRALCVSGEYAYGVTTDSDFAVISISDPTSPEYVGYINGGVGDTWGLAVAGKYAYVPAYDLNRLTVIDISDPSNPTIFNSLTDNTYLDGAIDIYVSGKYAYIVAEGSSYLTVVDISDPASLSIAGYVTHANLTTPQAVYVLGRYAYVATYNDRLTVVDVSDPNSPSYVSSTAGAGSKATGICVLGKYAYTTGGEDDTLNIFDISDPSSPTKKGSYDFTSTGTWPYSLYVSGNYAFVPVTGGDCLMVFDVSDPTNPTPVGTYQNDYYANGAIDVFISGNYAYLFAFYDDLLTVLDISGIDVPGGNIGDIDTSSIEVTENMDIGNNLYVRSGLNVGTGGILSDGRLSVSDVSYFGDNVGIGALDPAQDLSIDGTLGILEGGSSPQYYSIFQGGDQSADITYTLPIDDGNNGEFLITNGSGTLSWTGSLPSGAADQTLHHDGAGWVASSLLVNDGTNIGIGDTSPAALLTVGDGDLFQVDSGGNLSLNVNGATTALTVTQSGSGDLVNMFDGLTEVFTIEDGGNVGIGTTNPSAALDVGGGSGQLADGAGDLLVAGDLEVDDDLRIDGGGLTTSVPTTWDLVDSQTSALDIESGLINLDTQNSRVGIGLTQPDEKLHLTGGGMLQTISTGLAVVGSTTGSELIDANSVHVSGKYAYVAAMYSHRLNIVDISDPTAPTLVGSIQDATELDYAVHAYVSGKYAYVAAYNYSGLTIVDISDPSSPSITGSVSSTSQLYAPRGIYVSGRYAYVPTSSINNRLTIVDVSNPSSPTIVGSIQDATQLDDPQQVYVQGKYAYVAVSSGDRLTIVDVSDPSSPTIAGSVYHATQLNQANSVYVSGRYAYVAAIAGDCLTIVDISDPASPSIVSSITDTNLDNVRSVYVSGKYAYATIYNARLTIVDVSDPSSPSIAGSVYNASSLNGINGNNSLYVSGKYAYVACYGADGLTIVDISGIDVPGGNIGDISSSTIDVTENMDIGNNLYVRNGLNVGSGGILSDGRLSVSDVSYFVDKVGIKNTDPDYDLTLDGSLGILEGGSSPQYYSIFQGGDQTADITYTLPIADGGSGYFLTTNGSGTLSWATRSLVSGSADQTLRHDGSDWVASSLLVNDGTNIGIGDTSPAALLTVGDGDLFQINSSGEVSVDVNTASTACQLTQWGAGDFLNLFDSSTEVFTVAGTTGNVGIGTTDPSAGLDVGGGSGELADGGGDLLVAGDLEIDGDVRIDGGALTTSLATAWDLANSQTSSLNIESGLLNLDTQNSRVGIGTTSPDERLHLTGGTFLHTSSDPALSSSISNCSSIDVIYGLYVSGKYVYAAAEYSNDFTIIDISDPTNPKIEGTIGTANSGALGGACSVHVAGKYAYQVSRDSNYFNIIDVSNPSDPSIVGSISSDTQLDRAMQVYVSGKYAYVTAEDDDALTIVDISDAANPSIVASLSDTSLNAAHGLYVSGKYAYIAVNYDSRLAIVDISDPTSPTIVGSVKDTTNLFGLQGVYVSGRYAYTTAFDANRFTVVDVSDPTSPTVISSIQDDPQLREARRLVVSGKYAYVNAMSGDHFTIVDISDPTSPSIVGSISGNPEFDQTLGISISGKYAYIGAGQSCRFTIIDLPGIDVPGGNIDDISASTIEVTENMDIGNNLYVRSGLNIGSGGILTDGRLSISDIIYFGDKVGIGVLDPAQDLSIDGTLGILEGGSSPQYYSIFQGGDQSADITYTLPTNDGDNGQVLTTNGTGTLSWSAASNPPSGSAEQTLRHNGTNWVANSVLVNDGTNIGIGDTSPASLLTVGDGDLFQVNSSGAIASAAGITSSGTITFSGLGTDGPVYTSGGTGTLNSEAQLATSRGGTGQDFESTAQGNIIYFSGVGTMAALAPGTDGQFLKTQGAGANPVWADASGTNTTGPTLIVASSDSKDTSRADYVCDGTDDDVTIEQAIAALPLGGGTVLLLEGTYNIGGTSSEGIDITKSNVSLIGSGRSTILKVVASSGSVSAITVGDGGTTAVEGVVITYLQIDGNEASASSNTGIHFSRKVSKSQIRNNWIHDCYFAGIHLNCGADGPDNNINNLILYNDVRDNDGFGIALYNGESNIVSGNYCGSNVWDGIKLTWTGSRNNVISNNILQSNADRGIDIVNGGNNVVLGNITLSNGEDGILISSSNNTITGNIVWNNGGTDEMHGIRLGGSNNIVSSNRIYDSDNGTNTTYGIYSWGTDAYLIGNEISGDFTAEVGDTGTNTTIQHRDEFEIEGTMKAARFLTQAADTGITLTTADFGKTITVDNASAQVVNLPSVASTEVGAWFRIIKLGAGQVTIDAADSDTIADSSSGGTIYNDQSAEDYATITVELASETEWIITGSHGTWTTS